MIPQRRANKSSSSIAFEERKKSFAIRTRSWKTYFLLIENSLLDTISTAVIVPSSCYSRFCVCITDETQ